MNRLYFPALALALALAAGCASGDAPAGPASNDTDNPFEADVTSPPIVDLVSDSAFDRFDDVWVEVSGVEVMDANAVFVAVDIPPDYLRLNTRTNTFGRNTNFDFSGYSHIRLTITGAFAIEDGVSEDLSIEPLQVVAEIGGAAEIQL